MSVDQQVKQRLINSRSIERGTVQIKKAGNHQIIQIKSINSKTSRDSGQGTVQNNFDCAPFSGNQSSSNHELNHNKIVLPIDCKDIVNNQSITNERYSVSNDQAQKDFGTRNKTKVLLATAVVFVQDKNKNWIACRTLLDSGSQSNFITTRLQKSLHLLKSKTSITVSGFNQQESKINEKCKTLIRSRFNDYTEELEFLIAPKITEKIPDSNFVVPNIKELNINLADPLFNKRGSIDMLLGAEIFYSILQPGRLERNPQTPLLQETHFGWIAVGKVFLQDPSAFTHRSFVINNLDEEIQRMWALDKCSYNKEPLTTEEKQCEQHYVNNYSRDKNGRFVVRFPLKINRKQLGKSYWIALKRLQYLQTKFQKNPKLKKQYTDFINEYRDMGHLEEIFVDENIEEDPTKIQYLPHHCILRDSSSTTKLRVVFDGSALTVSGVSLNETQMVGAKQQKDLFDILLRFGNHKYAMTADVEKMYRQLKMHEDDCDLQRILWIENGQIKIFRLKTVTYGTTSASFLATRSLKQLALDEQEDLPLASEVALKDYYMDDLMTGSDSLEEAIKLQNQMIILMSRGGFSLHKWCSNDPKILENIDENLREKQVLINQEDTVKALGMRWIPIEDCYTFKIDEIENLKINTKRTVLSDIAKLFDPMGFLGPVVVKAKIFMQHLWILKLDWDQPLPEEENAAWINYRKQLLHLNGIKIQRFNGRIPNAKLIELHGFADASQNAYGACIYIKVVDEKNNISIKLLASKSRITPIKQQSIVRMELCAALLLARLMQIVVDALELKNVKKFYWSDSTIVLSWIKGESSILKVFVGNRVAEIQDLTEGSIWNHVRSLLNPADVLSRGITADELKAFLLWWNGPPFLHDVEETSQLEYEVISQEELPEKKPSKIILTLQSKIEKPFFQEFIEKFSSLQKLQRVTAYIWRFYQNCKIKNKIRGPLTVNELKESMQKLCKLTQELHYSKELKMLRKNKCIQKDSHLKLLNPFVDQHLIMRVGGRLSRSTLPFEQKHQILLPQKSHLTNLIIQNEHIRHLHAGAQATLSAVRQHYWPVNGKTAVKIITSKCVLCFRLKPIIAQQLMSDLPSSRVQENRPFLICGVDYCGPFMIRNKNQRGGSNIKAYIAVFICFSTKAVHLEVVSDLSTPSFKASLKRLISRRGAINKLYSDNAKNFVGAKNDIEEFKTFIRSSTFDKEIKEFCLNNQIEWKFISPYSPTQGGLWEAAVKSVKHHLKRTVTTTLTFEELTTITTQIEGILNSRPLTPLSSDPEDLNVLTPGHFLIGHAITIQPDYDLSDVNLNRLDRWQQVQHMTQSIWKRWHKDYLNELQQRKKWNKEQPDIKIGDMVVIKDDNLPSTKWMLARVVEVHLTDDNKVRTVSLKTKNGTTSRSITKICPLPIDDNKAD